MKRRRFTHLLYIFLLLFAQQSAFAHAAWHTHEPPLSHQHNKGDASFQGDLCDLHGAFGQVLGAVQSGALQHAIPHGVAEPIAYRAFSCAYVQLHVPLSRGPPVLS